jgi:cell wall-associated NlpC family hydrolase
MPTAQQAVADAMRYTGHPYVWGAWDCSGFMNHVFGQDLSMAIPGYQAGTYTGPPPHGPVVSDWIAWDGAVTIPGPPQPGDLVCFGPDVHIGMATSSDQFISALNPALGTQVIPIAGAAPGQLIYRQVSALGQGGTLALSTTADVGGVLTRVLLAVGLAAGVMLGLAAAVGVVAAVGPETALAWVLARRRRTEGDF